MKIELNGSKALVYSPYNKDFVAQIRSIGNARWDSARKAWSVPAECVDQVREIMVAVYGESDIPAGKKVSVRLTFTKPVYEYCDPVTIYGKTVSKAFGRDTGARPGDDVVFISGKPESGGSAKNWTSVVPRDSVVVLHNVPESKLSEALPDGVEMELIQSTVNRAALEEEKARLLARIAEINKLLEEG